MVLAITARAPRIPGFEDGAHRMSQLLGRVMRNRRAGGGDRRAPAGRIAAWVKHELACLQDDMRVEIEEAAMGVAREFRVAAFGGELCFRRVVDPEIEHGV